MSSEVENMMSGVAVGSSVNEELTEEQAGSLERMFSAELINMVSTDKIIVLDIPTTPAPEPEPEPEPAPEPEP